MFGKISSERLVELKDLPQSSIGAPCPMIFSTEHELHVTYYLQTRNPNWDGTTVQIVDPNSTVEPSIIVTFQGVIAHYFGMPNDEAISGHPLYKLGLEPYAYFEVLGSAWRDELERMNRVHPYHKKERYEELRHFIFTFHDTTLEVLAKSYRGEITDLPLVANLQRKIGKE